LVEVALQGPAGVAPERLPVRRVDVAEHAGDLLVLPPGKHGEGRRVGPGEHVGFLHPGVTVDGRPVEGHALIERHLELRRADRDRLQEALDVGEPEADEADTSLFDGAEDVVGLFGHVATGWGTRQHYAVSAVSPSRREVNTPTTVPTRATPTTTRIPTGKLVASVTAATAAGPAMNPTRLPTVRAARPVPSDKTRRDPARRYRRGNTTATPRPHTPKAPSATAWESVVTKAMRLAATTARPPYMEGWMPKRSTTRSPRRRPTSMPPLKAMKAVPADVADTPATSVRKIVPQS